MEFNEKNSLYNAFLIPHIALTYFKYRAKGSSIFKGLNIDLTVDQFIILKMLSQYSGCNQQDLSELMYKDKSNFSRMADTLEQKGYINRSVDLKNNRAIKKLFITHKGKILVESLDDIIYRLHNLAVSDFTEDEIAVIKSLMSKIRNNLDKKLTFKGEEY